MSQKVSAREIALVRTLDEIRAGTHGMVQCDGCADRVLVMPGRPGHLDDCDLCNLHCSCFRTSDHNVF